MRKFDPFVFLAMLIAGLYVVTSFAGLKTIPFGPFAVSAGVLFIAAVKPLLDIVNELYGAAATRMTVISMSIVRVIIFLGLFGLAMVPAVREPLGFGMVLSGSIWLFLFGVIAELVASVAIDIPIFTWLKEHSKFGFLTRQYMSNVSIAVQSVIFTTLYLWLFPGVPWIKFFLGQFTALLIVSSVLAPFAAWAVRKLKRRVVNEEGRNFTTSGDSVQALPEFETLPIT